MPKFGKTSLRRLKECDDQLQQIVLSAIGIFDFSVVDGYRNKQRQNEYYKKKKSQLKWPNGKHNVLPSKAIDLAPYDFKKRKIDWKNRDRFILLAGIIKGIAKEHNVAIIWGGDWNNDTFMKDQKFCDLGHFELVES